MMDFLLAVTVLVVIVGFYLFGPPRENGRYSFRVFFVRAPFRPYFVAKNPFVSPPPGNFVFDF